MQRTIAILLLAGLLPLAFSVTGCKKETREHEPAVIRLMNYNIAAGYGNIHAIAEVIREFDPDVVALQEVDVYWSIRSDHEHQAVYLAEALDMHYFFAPIYTLPPDREGDREGEDVPQREYGLAFLSKEPIRHAQNHQITRHSTQAEVPGIEVLPGFPEIALPFSGGIVHFFNTHLDYRPDPSVRQTQVMEMIEIMEQAEGPVVLAGDLNARPGAPELDPLFVNLRDAWDARADGDDPGYTFPADAPDRRIDYILHSPHFEVVEVTVPDRQTSDHLPIVIDLIIREEN
ncbi:MAG: metal-dependent hydrolase [Balneolaceae bacterium]|nr:MAG: metal-dependent hydrolase [Balneolaceae bacterium]